MLLRLLFTLLLVMDSECSALSPRRYKRGLHSTSRTGQFSRTGQLLPPQFDVICDKPNDAPIGHNERTINYTYILKSILERTIEYTYILKTAIEQFELSHITCPATQQFLRNVSFHDVITGPSADCSFPENVMLMEYYRFTKLMYISSVLKSHQAEVCCISQPREYLLPMTRLYEKWLQLYKYDDQVPRLPAPCCLLRAEVLPYEGLDHCGFQRNVIYITLLHMLDEMKASTATLTNMTL